MLKPCVGRCAGRLRRAWTAGQLNSFLTAVRQHRWDDTLPATALLFTDDYPRASNGHRGLGRNGRGQLRHNALAETVIGLYKPDLVHWEGPWAGADDLELATLSWVDWFNQTRLHSALSYRTPIEVETEYYLRQNDPAEPPLAGQPTV